MIVIAASFAVAFMLTLVPLPSWVTPYRPDWIALVLIYWALALPHRVGPGVGWFTGLLVDVMQAELLGVNALGLATVAFVTNRFHLRVRMFPWWQQTLYVFGLLLLNRGIIGWLRSLITNVHLDVGYWIPCLVAMIVWPWLFVVLRDLRRKAKVR